jgi:parvulin-like peptidyl-prolyl isomerase
MSQPVLTQFGYHLIKLDSRAGDTLNVRHILLRIEPSDSSASKVDREADQLAKLAASSDQAAKFDEAARTLKLTPFTVPVTEGEPAQYNGRYVPSVSAWAFNGAKVGETSDLFDAEDGYYLARLDTLSVGGKTFDAVKGEVRHRVAQSRAVERMVPSAQALANAARTSTLESAAAAKGLTVTKTGLTNRSGAARLFGSLGEAVGAAFALPANTLSTPIRQDDGVFVMHVDARKPADRAAFEKQKNDLRAGRLQQLRTQRLQMFLDDLRKSAKLTDKRKDINAQIRRQSTT